MAFDRLRLSCTVEPWLLQLMFLPRGKHARCTGSSSLTGLRLALVLAVCWPALVLVGSPGKNLPASAGLIFQSGRPEECSPFSRWSLDPSEIHGMSRCQDVIFQNNLFVRACLSHLVAATTAAATTAAATTATIATYCCCHCYYYYYYYYYY